MTSSASQSPTTLSESAREGKAKRFQLRSADGLFPHLCPGAACAVCAWVDARCAPKLWEPELLPRFVTESTIDRFWSKVAKGDGCWLWTGSIMGVHGCFTPDGRGVVSAHRFSVELSTGRQIPRGMFVCHRCDTPHCVRPDHLFIGTPAENSRDMVTKGRHVQGPGRGKARISEGR